MPSSNGQLDQRARAPAYGEKNRVSANASSNLQGFIEVYHAGADMLRTERDVGDLTVAYFDSYTNASDRAFAAHDELDRRDFVTLACNGFLDSSPLEEDVTEQLAVIDAYLDALPHG